MLYYQQSFNFEVEHIFETFYVYIYRVSRFITQIYKIFTRFAFICLKIFTRLVFNDISQTNLKYCRDLISQLKSRLLMFILFIKMYEITLTCDNKFQNLIII